MPCVSYGGATICYAAGRYFGQVRERGCRRWRHRYYNFVIDDAGLLRAGYVYRRFKGKNWGFAFEWFWRDVAQRIDFWRQLKPGRPLCQHRWVHLAAPLLPRGRVRG